MMIGRLFKKTQHITFYHYLLQHVGYLIQIINLIIINKHDSINCTYLFIITDNTLVPG